MWAQYEKYRSLRRQLDKAKPSRRGLLQQEHSSGLVLHEAAARYLENLKGTGETVTPKLWRVGAEQSKKKGQEL